MMWKIGSIGKASFVWHAKGSSDWAVRAQSATAPATAVSLSILVCEHLLYSILTQPKKQQRVHERVVHVHGNSVDN